MSSRRMKWWWNHSRDEVGDIELNIESSSGHSDYVDSYENLDIFLYINGVH